MDHGICDVIFEMVQRSLQPAKVIAEELGKPYSTFMRELDPGDKGAKLGVETLLPLMEACNSVAPLRYMAANMGYRVSSLREVRPDKPSFHEELLDTYQALVDYHRAMMEGQSLELVSKLREVLVRQLKEDFVAYTERRGRNHPAALEKCGEDSELVR